MQLSALKYCLALLIVLPGTEALSARSREFVLFQTEDWARETQSAHPQAVPAANPAVPGGNAALRNSKTPQYTPLTNREKWRYYWHSTYGPVGILRITATSGISQAQDDNPEWGQGMEGYGKRFASKLGHRIVRRSIHHGLGALLKEDPRYIPSGGAGFFPRALYAASRTFVVRMDNGSDRFADAHIISVFAGAFISRTWHPESDRSARSALESATISLGVNMGLNVLKEFWPDVRRFIQR